MLNSSWEFWYHKRSMRGGEQANGSEHVSGSDKKEGSNGNTAGSKNLSYKDQLKPLGKISSLEEFQSYYQFMKKVRKMPRDIDLFFFRHGETPMWEESPEGGIWITKIRREEDVDNKWEALLLSMVGEQFGEPNVIGVSLSLRSKDKLFQVWLKDARDLKMKTNVSNKMRHFLKLNPDLTTLYFKEHQDSMKDQSTMKNALGYKFEKKNKDVAEDDTDKGAFEGDKKHERAGTFKQRARGFEDDRLPA